MMSALSDVGTPIKVDLVEAEKHMGRWVSAG